MPSRSKVSGACALFVLCGRVDITGAEAFLLGVLAYIIRSYAESTCIDAGQKHEWATVKNGELYVGSIGKEFTSDGEIVHENNMWVAIVGLNGAVRHQNWSSYYAKIRTKLGCSYPGYVIHEAIEWSAIHNKWFVLPRRVSTEPYDDMADEKRGSNIMLIASEDFEDIQVVYIGDSIIAKERGFSSFKFIPGTKDMVILALKSMENEALSLQGAYVTVFDVTGKILMPETPLPGQYKFEGLAFLYDY
ncbi:soluble calcium-activated nucleotidase [Thraustotheca clavata]|uniref:Soluble calcium-activated nucleotidase n=1 Tax=Thraustotheca clavata TaxID=74557 RepID=A0A1W0A760_9STRA|nr:soluble calcium-activated nucleotidase [Thraustotheca clavata]